MKEAKLRWSEHVQRRDAEYIGRRMLRMETPSSKKRGRPKRRFMEMEKADSLW